MKNEKKRGPIVEEPDDDEISQRWFPFGNVFRDFGSFGQFQDKIGNLDGFYSEVRSFSSVVEYKDGKKVKDEKNAYHYIDDNGKKSVKILKTPDGLVEDIKKIK